jgi:hypothetical protein
LKHFRMEAEHLSTKFLREAIISGKESRSLNNTLPPQI